MNSLIGCHRCENYALWTFSLSQTTHTHPYIISQHFQFVYIINLFFFSSSRKKERSIYHRRKKVDPARGNPCCWRTKKKLLWRKWNGVKEKKIVKCKPHQWQKPPPPLTQRQQQQQKRLSKLNKWIWTQALAENSFSRGFTKMLVLTTNICSIFFFSFCWMLTEPIFRMSVCTWEQQMTACNLMLYRMLLVSKKKKKKKNTTRFVARVKEIFV